jgi:hypothetical protein
VKWLILLTIVLAVWLIWWVTSPSAHRACTHGVSSIGPATITAGKMVAGSTVPHTEACLP